MNAQEAASMYRKITGYEVKADHTVIEGMRRLGYQVCKINGRLSVEAEDVELYAACKIKTSRRIVPGRGISLTGSTPFVDEAKRTVRNTYDAIAQIAVRQKHIPIQRDGYVELVPGPRYRNIEPELEFNFMDGAA